MTPDQNPSAPIGWLWYFLVLGILTVASAAGLIAYNLHQQLRREQLIDVKTRWEQNGPRDYHLVFTKKGSVEGTFEVDVRKGKVIRVQADGQPLESRLWDYYSMSSLFEDLEKFMDLKEEPGGPRRFLRADFDPADGHLIRFVYSDSKTRQGIEVLVGEFKPVSE